MSYRRLDSTAATICSFHDFISTDISETFGIKFFANTSYTPKTLNSHDIQEFHNKKQWVFCGLRLTLVVNSEKVILREKFNFSRCIVRGRSRDSFSRHSRRDS